VNGKPLREADLERVLEYVRLGFTVRAAAEALERPASTLYVVLNHEDVKDRYEEAKQVGHDARADRMREAILVHAEDGNTKALEIGSRWVPELRDTKRVEVTGANGAALEVAVDHDFGRIRYCPHAPTEQQTLALVAHRFLPDDEPSEVFYGGAAGGGKSDWLLMGALEYVDVPGYAAIIFRRTYTDLSLPGAIMARSPTRGSRTPTPAGTAARNSGRSRPARSCSSPT
jgi:hypothetical protein